MKSTTLVQLMALPAVLANFAGELVIVVPDTLTGVSVAGKGDPTEPMMWTGTMTPGIDKTVRCLGDDNFWTFRGCEQRNETDGSRPRVGYRQVGQFNFTEATEQPRPLIIDLDSSTAPSTLQMCNITVTGEGKDVWDVVDGFVGPKSGAIDVHCGNNITWDEFSERIDHGLEWEKKIGEELRKAGQPPYEYNYSISSAVSLPTEAAA